MSLMQQHHHLISAIDAVFREPAECVGKTFFLQRVVRLPDSSLQYPLFHGTGDSKKDGNRIFRLTFVYCGSEKKMVVAYPKNETSLHIVELPTHVPRSETKVRIESLNNTL